MKSGRISCDRIGVLKKNRTSVDRGGGRGLQAG